MAEENTASTGGGIENEGYNDPILTNCVFLGNSAKRGSGFYNTMGSAPELIGCTFSQNSAAYSGGGICIFSNYGYSPVLTDCRFSANRAGSSGGAICNSDGALKMVNCLFTGNSSGKRGGAVNSGPDKVDEESGPMFVNCILTGNKAADAGGALYAYTIEPHCRSILANCIIWDDTTEQIHAFGPAPIVNNSNVGSSWPGEGNIEADPYFADPGYRDPNGTPEDANDDFWVNGDYHLKSQAGRWDPNSESWVKDDVTSSCIDAGNADCPIGEEPAPNGNRRNMGAYSGTAEASKSPTYWHSIADLTNDWVVDFNDLKIFANYWLETGECIPSDFNHSRFVDFIDFAIFCQ